LRRSWHRLIEQTGRSQAVERGSANDVGHAAEVALSGSVKRRPHGRRNADGDDGVATLTRSLSSGAVDLHLATNICLLCIVVKRIRNDYTAKDVIVF
jgi:hypothetical protein